MRRGSVLPAIPLICLTAILLCACYGCNGRPAPSLNPDVIRSAVRELRKTCDRVKSGRGSCENTALEVKDGKTESSSVRFRGAFDRDRFKVAVVGNDDGYPANKIEVAFDGKALTFWDKADTQPPGYYWIKKGMTTRAKFYAGTVNPIKQIGTFWIGWDARDPSHRKATGYETLDGDRCLVIEEGGGKDPTVGKWWLDVEKGYLPLKLESYEKKSFGRLVHYLDQRYDIRDYGNRLWAPSKVVTILYDDEGRMALKNTVVYSKDVKLNVPILLKELELKIPAGVKKHE